MGYLDQILHTYLFLYCPATLVCKTVVIKGLSSIILASQGILVKILKTLELHGKF